MGKIAVSKGGSSYITFNYPPEIVKQFVHPTRNQQSDAAAGDARKAISQAGDNRDFIIIIYLVCVCVHCTHVEVRRQFVGVGSLLPPCGSHG